MKDREGGRGREGMKDREREGGGGREKERAGRGETSQPARLTSPPPN